MGYSRIVILSWLVPLSLLIVWQFSVSTGWLSSRILPEPLQVFSAGWNLIKNGELWENLGISALRAGIGFIIGCLLYTSPSPRDLSTSRMPSSA